MTLIVVNHLSEPSPKRKKSIRLSEDQAELRALLLEGANSPKTTLLNNDYIERLRRESRARMIL